MNDRTRATRRHHAERIADRRLSQLKALWPSRLRHEPEGWAEGMASRKTNPFTACACQSCTDSVEHREDRRRSRHQARLEVREYM